MGRESQRDVTYTGISVESHEVVAFSFTRGSFHQKPTKNYNLFYDYCNYKGHTREKFYKLNGYPTNFKSKRKGSKFSASNFAGNIEASGTTGLQMHIFVAQESFPAILIGYHLLKRVINSMTCMWF